MDDRTTGVGDERMTGRGDDSAAGRTREAAPPSRSAPAAPERIRTQSDERARGPAGVIDRAPRPERETERLRAEIEQTRDDMSETIDAIQDRLRPGSVAANAAAGVRDAAGAAVENVRNAASDAFDDVVESRVVEQVRSNPVPAVMVGVGIVGLAWLAFGGRDRGRRRRTEVYDHGTSFGYYERRDDRLRTAVRQRSAYGTERRMGGAAGEMAWRTGEYAREASARARQTTRRAQSRLQRAITDNPLAIGAAALALGAILGMALPETGRENEWLGETRDDVVEGAQEMARTAAERVQEVATDAAKRVQELNEER